MTLAEKYEKDYNNRFARKAIVNDDCIERLQFGDYENSCSYKQINDWTQKWMIENGQVEEAHKNRHDFKKWNTKHIQDFTVAPMIEYEPYIDLISIMNKK